MGCGGGEKPRWEQFQPISFRRHTVFLLGVFFYSIIIIFLPWLLHLIIGKYCTEEEAEKRVDVVDAAGQCLWMKDDVHWLLLVVTPLGC